MKQSRIEETVEVYSKDAGFTKDQLRLMRLACENVERETRQECVSKAYNLAEDLAKTPIQSN